MQKQPPADSNPNPENVPTTNLTQKIELARRDNNNHGLIKQGRDVQEVVCNFLPIRAIIDFGMTCSTLWQRAQPILLRRLLQLNLTSRVIDGFDYLMDVIELSPIFQRYPLNYNDLARILSNALPLIDILFKNDPNCEWKIAALCGRDDIVRELLGDKITTTVDAYGRGPLHYYAIGGQIDCIKRHLARYHPPAGEKYTAEEIERFDPGHKLPTLAALAGHNHLLEYFHGIGYDLKKVYPRKYKTAKDETLLTYAHFGGHNDTVDFLLKGGVDPTIGPHRAIMSSMYGHWDLWKREDHKLPESREELIIIANNACKMGNYAVALELSTKYDILGDDLVESVIAGGHSNIFWQFLKEDLFSLDTRFNNGVTVLHRLARAGHLSLIREVLATPEGEKMLYELDEDGRCVLHHAAEGGHYHVYNYLQKHYYADQEPPRDKNGLTVAHTAAIWGYPWFLRRLQQDDPELLSLVTDDNSTLLHFATVAKNPQLMIMLIEEFKMSWRITNDNQQSPIETLITIANDDVVHANVENATDLSTKIITAWSTLAIMLEKYPEALDIQTSAEITIRELLVEYTEDEKFPGFLFEKVLSTSDDNLIY